MKNLYNFALWLYKIAINFAALFNSKAKSMSNGWKEAFDKVAPLKKRRGNLGTCSISR